MTHDSHPKSHVIDRDLRRAPIDAVRRLALDPSQGESAKRANEWYWVTRFGHPLHGSVHLNTLFRLESRFARRLSSEEIEALTNDDLAVLALSESIDARTTAAAHESTPPDSLAHLAMDREEEVYREAGHNPATPASAIANMRRAGRTDDIDPDRLKFLWAELPNSERIDGRVALEVARGYHGNELRVALARHGHQAESALVELASSVFIPAEAAIILVSSSSISVRAALASNEARAVSESILSRLAEDHANEVRLAAIENRRLPESAVDKLLEDRRLRSRVIARAPLSVRQLRALEKDDETRRDVVDRLDSNPMGWGRTSAVVTPPDIVELMREWAHSVNEITRIGVARNAATPLDVLEEMSAEEDRLATYVQGGFRTSVANHHWSNGAYLGTVGWYGRFLSESDLAVLAASPSPALRAGRAGRSASRSVLDVLAGDPEPVVRKAVAGSEWVKFDQLAGLADDDDDSVRHEATRAIIELLAHEQRPHQQWSGDWLEHQTDLPDYFPRTPSGRPDMSVMRRVYLAGQLGWSCSRESLDRLARSRSIRVRAAVAGFESDEDANRYTDFALTADTLLALASDPEVSVRSAAYGNAGEAAVNAAKREDAPTEALTQWARSRSRAVRSSVARNAKSPAALLANLARDESSEVRVSVAVNHATPTSALIALSHDDDDDVLCALLLHPQAPRSFLELQAARVGGRNRAERHRRIAAHRGAPVEVLRQLAYSRDSEVRRLVADNPATPSDSMEILSLDESALVRATAVKATLSGPERAVAQSDEV